MKNIKNNIWYCWKQNNLIVIPTNGTIKKDGSCVMGRGIAKQAKKYIPNIEYRLGNYIQLFGNNVHYIGNNIISFPVKHNWWENADLNLIKKSAIQLIELSNKITNKKLIFIPKVGCGNGKLNWKDVKKILDLYLNDKFILVDYDYKN